ncbi:hypothetical protein E5288_WYG015366 [Bos mutus]|uniref:Uncharacterized protein n=1 Tax=Bos mutus TaxID=72004 RepID=A0A6B0RD09_9CETA|nr:hypothetical protein [Bos mutus]
MPIRLYAPPRLDPFLRHDESNQRCVLEEREAPRSRRGEGVKEHRPSEVCVSPGVSQKKTAAPQAWPPGDHVLNTLTTPGRVRRV